MMAYRLQYGEEDEAIRQLLAHGHLGDDQDGPPVLDQDFDVHALPPTRRT